MIPNRNNLTLPYKLRIAKIVYKEIESIIEKFEGKEFFIQISIKHPDYIEVDGERFYSNQLKTRNYED